MNISPSEESRLVPDARPILDYPTPQQPAGPGLDLQESDGQIKVILPVVGRWVQLVVCVSTVLAGTNAYFTSIDAAWDWIATILFFALAVSGAITFFRWKREGEILVATKEGLLWSRLGLLGRVTKMVASAGKSSPSNYTDRGEISPSRGMRECFVCSCVVNALDDFTCDLSIDDCPLPSPSASPRC